MNKRDSQIGSALIVTVIVIAILILGGLGYVIWNNFFNTAKETSQSTENNQGTSSDVIPNVKITLPNGKTAVYPDIKTYKSIEFVAQSEFDNPEYVRITHKAYKEYLDSLGGNVDDLCGTDDNLKALKKDIIYGLLNTSNKTITYPQNWNCVELIASDENPRTEFKADAQQVLDRVKGDINSFLESVTIN